MSAYLTWLQKQETKVRRPAKPETIAARGLAPAAPLTERHTTADAKRSRTTGESTINVDDNALANPTWLQRREARLSTIKEAKEGSHRSLDARNSKAAIADAVSKYTSAANAAGAVKATGSKKRSLRFVTMRASTTATAAAAAASRASGTTATSSSSSERKENIGVIHSRKRAIDDVEAPSKLSSLPLKHRKVDDFVFELDEDEDERKAEDRTPTLDAALARIDKKYGPLARSMEHSGNAMTEHWTPDLEQSANGLEEVAYWQSVDRFASLQ